MVKIGYLFIFLNLIYFLKSYLFFEILFFFRKSYSFFEVLNNFLNQTKIVFKIKILKLLHLSIYFCTENLKIEFTQCAENDF